MTSSLGNSWRRAARAGRWGLRLGAGLAVTAVVAYLAWRQLDLRAAWMILRQASPLDLGLAMAAMLFNIALKVLRWQRLLPPAAGRLTWDRLLRALMIGQLGNALLPVRLGDVARIAAVSAAERGTAGPVLMTVVVEKAVDSLMLLAVLLGLFPFVALAPRPSYARLLLSVAALLLLGALTVLAMQEPARQRLLHLARRAPGARYLERAVEVIGGLRALREPRAQLRLWGVSLAIWLLAGLVNHLGFRAVHLDVPLAAAYLLAVAEISGNNVAYAPGGVGVYHSICILTLALFGVRAERALSAAIVLHLVVYLPIVLGGLTSVWLESLDRRPS